MRPSAITREQSDVYLLAIEFRSLDCKAMAHDQAAGVQRSRGTGSDARIDWAISYLSQIPAGGHDLVDKAHRDGEMTLSESRRAGTYLRHFYWRIKRKRLYADGLRWLHLIGR